MIKFLIAKLNSLAERANPGSCEIGLGRWRIFYGCVMFIVTAVWLSPAAYACSGERIETIRRLDLPLGPYVPYLYVACLTAWIFTAAGLFTSLSQFLGVMTLAALLLLTGGKRDWTPLFFYSIIATAFPWSRRASLDALIRTHRKQNLHGLTPSECSFPQLLAVVTVGLGYGAAALAKLRLSGGAWSISGVRGAFFEDWSFGIAPLPARYLNDATILAVFGAAALAIEIAWLFVPFFGPKLRLAFTACCAFPLVSGFLLFQGHVWPAWWAMVALASISPTWLSSHLTADRCDELSDRCGIKTLRRWSLLMIVLLFAIVGVQVVACASKLEYRFLCSWYPMYTELLDNTNAADHMAAADRRGRNFRYAFEYVYTDGRRRQETVTSKVLEHFLHSFSRVDIVAQQVARLNTEPYGVTPERARAALRQRFFSRSRGLAHVIVHVCEERHWSPALGWFSTSADQRYAIGNDGTITKLTDRG